MAVRSLSHWIAVDQFDGLGQPCELVFPFQPHLAWFLTIKESRLHPQIQQSLDDLVGRVKVAKTVDQNIRPLFREVLAEGLLKVLGLERP